MKNSKDLQMNSRRDIIWLLGDAYQAAISTAGSKEKEQIIGQLALTLERLLTNFKSTVQNYKLLTIVYEQQSKCSLKQMSKEIKKALETVIVNPSQFHDTTIEQLAKFSQETDRLIQMLQTINQKIAGEIDTYKENWQNTIRLTKHVLKVPDLAREMKMKRDLFSCIDGIEKHFRDLEGIQGSKDIGGLKKEWASLATTFEKYKNIESYEGVKRTYHFSDETMDVIEKLLNEQEIPLSSISYEVLKEISRFGDFCNAVQLKFQPLEEKT